MAAEQGRCCVESLTRELAAWDIPGAGATNNKKTRVAAVMSLLIVIAAGSVGSPVKVLGLE